MFCVSDCMRFKNEAAAESPPAPIGGSPGADLAEDGTTENAAEASPSKTESASDVSPAKADGHDLA